MSDLKNGERPTRRSDVLARVFEAEAIVMDPKTDAVHSLNESAYAVWSLCDGSMTLEEITAEMGRAFGVEPGSIAQDVRATITEFRSLGLLASTASPESTLGCDDS